MLLNIRYRDPHGIHTSLRMEIKNWQTINYGDAKEYRTFLTFLKNVLLKSNTLSMINPKLPNSIADKWNRKSLMLRTGSKQEPLLHNIIVLFEEEKVLVKDPIFSHFQEKLSLIMLEIKHDVAMMSRWKNNFK